MQGSVGSTPLALEFCGQISHARGGVAESRHLAAVRLMRDRATDGRTRGRTSCLLVGVTTNVIISAAVKRQRVLAAEIRTAAALMICRPSEIIARL